MKKGEIRDTQLANLVASEVEYILGSAGDARLADLIVTAVEPKANGRHFVICVAPDEEPAPFASAEELKELLKKASGYIRSELAEALNLKRTPEITIMPDPTYTGPWGKK